MSVVDILKTVNYLVNDDIRWRETRGKRDLSELSELSRKINRKKLSFRLME